MIDAVLAFFAENPKVLAAFVLVAASSPYLFRLDKEMRRERLDAEAVVINPHRCRRHR